MLCLSLLGFLPQKALTDEAPSSGAVVASTAPPSGVEVSSDTETTAEEPEENEVRTPVSESLDTTDTTAAKAEAPHIPSSASEAPILSTSRFSEMKPASKFGILELNTFPEGATVSLGGDSSEFEQRLGKTPLRTEVDPGKIVLVISLDGYETATAEIDVASGKTVSMQIKLEKATARSKKSIRAAGHALFWPGILTAGTGIALIAVDEPKKSIDTGMPGFITAGIGTAMIIAGGLILGLTFHDKAPYTMPTVSLSIPKDGGGAGVMIQKSF